MGTKLYQLRGHVLSTVGFRQPEVELEAGALRGNVRRRCKEF
jgi:hypothetical protein